MKDSKGVLGTPLAGVLPLLDKIYSRKGVVMSKSTNPGLVRMLRDHGWVIEHDKAAGIGEVRRQALRLGLKLGTEHMHFCECDRLIVWATRHSGELIDVTAKIGEQDLLIIGRTNRAFLTHPITQRDTEGPVNAVCSYLLGRTLDVTCASRGLSRSAARYVLAHSKAKGYETDVEWPFIVFKRKSFSTNYVAVEGLEYEDWLKEPDSIARLGYKKWLQIKDSDRKEWALRMKWAIRLIKTAFQLRDEI
jgi:hypothetical protein